MLIVSLCHCRLFFGDPQRICTTYTDAVAAQVALPGVIGQLCTHEHHILGALRNASFAQVAFGEVDVIRAAVVELDRFGRADPGTIAALGADAELINAWRGEVGKDEQSPFFRIALLK
jgi:hypothetical protein